MNATIFQPARALAAFTAFLLCASAAEAAVPPQIATPQAISPQEQDWETQAGRQRYEQLLQRGEIVPPQSPAYASLNPVANAIAAVANRQYFTPFHFILLNEPEPNAFSMPGGNVYVTTAMLSFARNRDELAGVLCHEVNHDIHHDMYNVYQTSQGNSGPPGAAPIEFERAAETNADRAGAYTCAKAGFNPWGMVWNMRRHRELMNANGRALAPSADHPSDDQRLADLTALLTSDAAFAKFRDDAASAVALVSPSTQYAPQYQQYPQQYQPYPPQQYQPYPPQQYQPYPPQQYQPYPPQYQQYPQQYPPYPPPPLPPCYPGC